VPPNESPHPEDDAEEVPAPDARRVAARCGALVALAYRSLLERGGSPPPDDTDRLGMLAWIDASAPDVAGEIEPAERALLERPVGSLSEVQVRDASWLVEPAAVLAWSLGRMDLPAYDVAVDGERVARAIGFLDAPWTAPDAATLRDRGELEDAWASALALHWRLRQWDGDHKPMDFARFVATCRWAPLHTRGLALWDGDLLLRGRRLAKAGDDYPECYSLARERHRALEWLLGDNAVLWSDVTTDT